MMSRPGGPVWLAMCCVLLALVAGGCSSNLSPGLDPPAESGRISGTLSFKLPCVYLAGQTTPEPAYSIASVGLFAPESNLPLMSCDPELSRCKGAAADEWQQTFEFTGVAFGTYEVRLYRRLVMDWNLYQYDEYWRSEQLHLTGDKPVISGLAGAVPVDCYGDRGEISGNLLADGNAVSDASFHIRAEASDPSPVYWRVGLSGTRYGRIKYRVTHLALTPLHLGWSPTESENPVVLTASDPVRLGLNLSTLVYPVDAGNAQIAGRPPAQSGQLHLKLAVSGDWDGDLVLVMKMLDSFGRADQGLNCFVLPANVKDGFLERWGLRLDASGGYTLRLYLLGDTPGETMLVYEHPTLIYFLTPPWHTGDPLSWYQPQAEVSLAIDYTGATPRVDTT